MKKNINKNNYLKRAATVGLVGVLSASMIACGSKENAIKRTAEGDTILVGESGDESFAFKSAAFVENTGFKIVLNSVFTGEAKEVFIIKDSSGKVIPVKNAKVVFDTNVTLEVDNSSINVLDKYTITYGDVTTDVRMPSQYSKKTFEDAYTYEGDDLGVTYSKDKSVFRLWAPTASKVMINLYESGTAGTNDMKESIEMTADVNGTWIAEKTGDLNGVYYTYTVTVNNVATEACDPYARAVGVNGNRAMVVDLDSTDPAGWDKDKNPNKGLNITDAIIYEMHIRDMTIDESSGINNKGKYLGLTEKGTKTAFGYSTGLDYIKSLGVNYVQIMPMFDFGSVDETKLDKAQYNWGYEPVNYNVPDGSYSTDPYKGEVRIKETKQMIQAFHNEGISVVMDVVFNHVYNPEEFCFNKVVPEYFSRVSDQGVYSDGSLYGNDVATERSMVRKYMVDSIKYWVEEYHIDGFKFELAGNIDTTTINEIIEEVHKTHPDVIFYGEGGLLKTTTTKGVQLATTSNANKMPGFAFFNDYFRDTVRGSNDQTTEAGKGFINGNAKVVISNLRGLVIGKSSWNMEPSKSINSAVTHGYNTLHDKIIIALKDVSKEDIIKRTKLSAAITITCQGVPFLMSGEEMNRTKQNEDGSYNYNSVDAPDSVNSIKYSNLDDSAVAELTEYYRGLIEFRKAHKGLRMMTSEEVKNNATVLTDTSDTFVACHIKGGANGESSKGIFIAYNGGNADENVTLPEGNWTIYINGEKAGTTALGTASGTITVKALTAMVLVLE